MRVVSLLGSFFLLGVINSVVAQAEPSIDFVAAGLNVTAPPAPDCFSNLNDVNKAIEERENPFVVVDYVLCPNTLFQIGSAGVGTEAEEAISIRKNSRFLCGKDGAFANNCTIVGGALYQIVSWPASFDEKTKENVLVSGITFRDSDGAAVLLLTSGDITFRDCTFDNQRATGVVQLLYTSVDDKEERKLLEIADEGEKRRAMTDYYSDLLQNPKKMHEYRERALRSLQESPERDLLVLEFDGCIFEFNGYGRENTVSTHHGIIGVETPSNKVIVKNTIFHDNRFGDEGITSITSCIDLVEKAELELENNCFLNNDIIGRGTVNMVNKDQIISVKNNFGTYDVGLECQFLHIESGGCIEYDLDSCPLDFEYDPDGSPQRPLTTSLGAGEASLQSFLAIAIGALFVLF